MPLKSSTHRIGILLFPEFSFSGLGCLLDPLFIVNWLAQETRFERNLLGIEPTVQASNGVPIAVETEWPAPSEFDTVFVLASFETKAFRSDRQISMWLRHCDTAGVRLVGIEMGVDVLAAAGLLDGHRAAVHWDNLEAFQELYPKIEPVSELYNLSGDRMTCAGGTAVIDMMLAWLVTKIEVALVDTLRDHLLERRQRRSDAKQLSHAPEHHVATSAQMRRLVRMMHQTLESPLNAKALAEFVGLSVRQLERRFRKEVGLSPKQYYLKLRINRAHRLLQQTDLSVSDVAVSSGFTSQEHFSRTYRRFFDCAPSEDRIQSRDAPVFPVSRMWAEKGSC
ncbi:GlxA family transcriptional regulator [Salinivibrio kushneri]|uniref:GlxA family transcriptional regulator n=1 Tax=Salinivibrio kushneri TaxID=1908198 RepID=UPI000986D5FB|nr:GlxA family transcriptional regulator [Salinivibrio kushneri]OOE58793.1 AraC family transcriptional regulator [Salinivibrio kushneri]